MTVLVRMTVLGRFLGALVVVAGCAGHVQPGGSVVSVESVAAAGAPTGVAREPEVPLLPQAVASFDLEAVRALRLRLSRLAARVAPGMQPASEDIVGTLRTGQRLEQTFPVRKGCYTAVGLAEAGGIVDLGLELELEIADTATPGQVHADTGKNDTAVVGESPGCLRVNADSELRLVMTAVSGAGLAAARIYGR